MSTFLNVGAFAHPPVSKTHIHREFGIFVREKRRAQRLSEVDLAWRIGITRAHLQDIEEGGEEVDLLMLDRIACAFGMSLSATVEAL